MSHGLKGNIQGIVAQLDALRGHKTKPRDVTLRQFLADPALNGRDLRITPGGRYDAQLRLDYDPVRGRFTTAGTLVKMRPYQEFFVILGHFALRSDPVLQPRSNQIRALVGYGEMNRRGWNAAFGFSYDVRQRFLQNQLIQVSYNGACCGIAFEYRRLALGPVRSENQFRVALIIANIGTFGNLRGQEKIF